MKTYVVKSTEAFLHVYESEEKEGIVLLFLHAIKDHGACTLIEQKGIQHFINKYHCVFFDQRGNGLSTYDLAKNVNLHHVMDDIRNIAIELHNRVSDCKLILVGDSLGATLAMQCVDLYPELFSGLILHRAILCAQREDALRLFGQIKKTFSEHDQSIRKTISILDNLSPEEFFRHQHIRHMIFSDKHHPIILQHIAAMSNWIFQIPCTEILKRITIPTLIMQGSCENRKEDGDILDVLVHLKNPFIIYEAFPECAQAIYQDHPERFIERIEQFLRTEFVCES